MERLLSKSRVLIGLCAVLLMSALNRQDPMVYAMFLFLAVVTVLGFLLPWLSLRSTALKLAPGTNIEVIEGVDCELNVVIERKLPWPAFMVDIETEWEWASQRIVLSHTVPVIRRGRAPDLGRLIRFPCRGHYKLVSARLSSGFPLGLIRASHALTRPQIDVRVLPKAQPVQWPLPWVIVEDPVGELTARRMGQSFELGMLRSYQHGDAVGRVNWRASARLGELVIQHFQQSGSVRLRVAVEVPQGASVGDAQGSGEQAIRLAVGVCDVALANNAQLFLHLEHQAEPARDASSARRALSEAVHGAGGLLQVMTQMTSVVTRGEQIAVVVSSTCTASQLLAGLDDLSDLDCQVLVCIAIGYRCNSIELDQARALQASVQQGGYATLMEAP